MVRGVGRLVTRGSGTLRVSCASVWEPKDPLRPAPERPAAAPRNQPPARTSPTRLPPTAGGHPTGAVGQSGTGLEGHQQWGGLEGHQPAVGGTTSGVAGSKGASRRVNIATAVRSS